MKIPRKPAVLAGLLCLGIVGVSATSVADNVAIGRYLSVAVKPHDEQAHLLQQHIHIKFPPNILTIQQAITFILQFSGYPLADSQHILPLTRAMLRQPLPAVDRTFGPMTLEQGLRTLAGDPFYLLVDPVHRLVSYRLKPSYRHLYEAHDFMTHQPLKKGTHDA